MGEVKGYKVFNPDWTCRGFQYKVGETYEEDVNPEVCLAGFHFCKDLIDCFDYYMFSSENKVAKIIALGEVVEEKNKCSTNKIRIVEEISWEEVLRIVNLGKNNSGIGNTGDNNTGYRNIGDYNSGHHNSGHHNTGHRNSGDYNSGHYNTGHRNTGRRNSGDCNTGDYNIGDCNAGYCNSGDCNTGDYNSGDCNTGDYNSGDCNTGDYNTGYYNMGNFCTGDFNISDYETGCFCTEKHNIRLFDKESNITIEKWRTSEAFILLKKLRHYRAKWIYPLDMTIEEKCDHPEYLTNDGYLKIYDINEVYLNWWDSLKKEEKNVIKNIPNFDADKFYRITGIRV